MSAQYHAFLQSRDGQRNYDETPLKAASDQEAKAEARDWGTQLQPVADDALLFVSARGRGVCTFKPTEF